MHTVATHQEREPVLFRNILLPIDGSELSLRAFALGLDMAGLCGAKVSVIHVVPPFHSLAFITEVIAASEFDYNQQAVKCATGYLEQAKELADDKHVACECHYVFGERPYEAILHAVDEHRCDLIVMASHGWHGLNKLILGSETQKVLSKATTPVLVCH
jgi:nucleotide-binding universal stress UspA family protein